MTANAAQANVPWQKVRFCIIHLFCDSACCMADKVPREVRSHMMSRIRSRGNEGTEKRMIEIFRTHGIVGWRRGLNLPGRPDFAFRTERVAVFVDGCFWHCCPQHGSQPASNTWYWEPKLRRNVDRDRAADAALGLAGWTVIRFWEHESIESAVAEVVGILAGGSTQPFTRSATEPDRTLCGGGP